jgi:hypothetical protein
MAEKYQRVRREPEKLDDNEIRVRRNNRIGNYLRRANDILTGKVQGYNSIVITGVAQAMENVVKLAELVKHRVPGLYQKNGIETIQIKDEYEPLEEGLDYLVFTRPTTMLTITLSLSQLDNRDIGYQDPIPAEEVQPYNERPAGGRSRRQSFSESAGGAGGARRRSRSRGGRGGDQRT